MSSTDVTVIGIALQFYVSIVFCDFSHGVSPPRHSSSNETPRAMKMDPTQPRSSISGPLGPGGFPHSYEFHTKRKMFDKGPEVCLAIFSLSVKWSPNLK